MAHLKVGDAAGFRAACIEIARSLAPVGPALFAYEANSAASAFTIGPNGTDDWTKPLAWMDHALARLDAIEKANPNRKDSLRRERHIYQITRGAVLYRAGRFEESAKVLREGITLHAEGGDYRDWVFLALSEQMLGHGDAAKVAATTARATKAKTRLDTVWDKGEIELLAAELDAALPAADK
jgi:hypothetical protein